MGAHHTKDKGDLGVAKVFADLAEQGFTLLFPATDHAPFDLVAYDGSRFIRVQVKYRAARRGVVTVVFRSVWNDRHGRHVIPMDKDSVEVVAIYCPDLDQCFYVDPAQHGGGVTLRFAPTRNRQELGVLHALHFRQMPRTGAIRRLADPSENQFLSSTLF